jgi:hypothetical protein
MPLSDFQMSVLRILARNRTPESYLAGATVVHRTPDSPRFSQDFDFFHDIEESVTGSAEADTRALVDEGYEVRWLLRAPTFSRAVVSRDGSTLKLEWAFDSAYRFFPVEADELCGYRLHMADAAVNKLLAMANRAEVRDFVDVLHLDKTYLSIGAMSWAACGKDPGFTPELLLEHAGRHACYRESDLARLSLAFPLNLRELKAQWLAGLEQARALISGLPPEEIGCLYLSGDGVPVTPDPSVPVFVGLKRHFGRLGGAWPVAVY